MIDKYADTVFFLVFGVVVFAVAIGFGFTVYNQTQCRTATIQSIGSCDKYGVCGVSANAPEHIVGTSKYPVVGEKSEVCPR